MDTEAGRRTDFVRGLDAGVGEVAEAARVLAGRVPGPLGGLAELAYNYRWSWTRGGPELFERIDPRRWARCEANPVRMLEEVSPSGLERLAGDRDFLERLEAVSGEVRRDLARPWRTGVAGREHPVAFFCAEYAVHRSLPVYSGGLGVLAGDMLKAASDLAVPMVGVGLMYRHGYFRQRIAGDGYQHEYWVESDPERMPAARLRDEDGGLSTIGVPIAGRQVGCQVWRVNVGRVGLLLLDADVDGNDPVDRFITSRLYVGDPPVRLAQYALLGIGGVRVLRRLGIDPAVVHLNEGHAAFAALELLDLRVVTGAGGAGDALEQARRKTVFTTHTPVPAGNDTYSAAQISEMLADVAGEVGVEIGELVARGRTNPDDEREPFGVTQFALRSSRRANGVAARHGEVAREMWRGLGPIGPSSRFRSMWSPTVFTSRAGLAIRCAACSTATSFRAGSNGSRIVGLGCDWRISDVELWSARRRQREQLVELVVPAASPRAWPGDRLPTSRGRPPSCSRLTC